MSRLSALSVLLAAACTPSAPPSAPGGDLFVGDPQTAATLAVDLASAYLEAGDHRIAATDEVAISSVFFDRLGRAHVRVAQTHAGVPVFGAEAIVHLAADGTPSMTDRFARRITVDPNPTLTAEQAVSRVSATLPPTAAVSADLQIVRGRGGITGDNLAWRIRAEDVVSSRPSIPVVFVDAHDGTELWRYDDLQTIKDRKTYTANNGTALPGTLVRSEGSVATGDVTLDNAHDFAGVTYDYYNNEQGRDSYNGLGAQMKSTVHFDVGYDNAFWSGTQTVYGDGAVVFKALSKALDVVGHEFTHGVTATSANLIYADESGGLNEATSDIMGAVIEAYNQAWVVDTDTWKVGEDIIKPLFGTALRFMDNPPADGISIDDYADYFDGMDVHYSSGLANKAFYLMEQDAALDIQGAADIWYLALTTYMTTSTTFHEARTATEDAAGDLYGIGSAEQIAVGAAWDGVGVFAPLPEVCTDAIDNDFDGLFDCDDTDCDLDAACVLSCPGGEFNGNLSAANKNDTYKDAVALSGHFEATLSGDAGTNFNLRLEALSAGQWILLQSSVGPTSEEFVSYDETIVRTHRWKVQRKTGTGDYTLCVQ